MLALFWRPAPMCMPAWLDLDAPTTVWEDAETALPFCEVPSPPPAPIAPLNVIVPSIIGAALVGQTLTRDVGVWLGTEPLLFTTQWLRNGVEIAGETGASYGLIGADIGAFIAVRVTATNTAGTAEATSSAIGPVVGTGSGDFTDEFSSEFA